MASIKRISVGGGAIDATPYVNNVMMWAYVNGVRIDNWVAQTQQPSPKITVQPTGSVGIAGGYVSGSYTLYCSTTNNANSYGAWRAFDGGYADAYGWATAAGDATPWIGILLPTALKNITVTVRNRTRASMVAGPISGTIYGSDTATLSGTSIGTFSGKPGATSAAGWSVVCNNYDNAYRFIRIAISTYDNVGGQDYASIGEIYIDGRKAA